VCDIVVKKFTLLSHLLMSSCTCLLTYAVIANNITSSIQWQEGH